MADLRARITTSAYGIPKNMVVSQNLISFFSKCLRIDSSKRWDLVELQSHPFMMKRQVVLRKLEKTMQIDPNETLNFRKVYEREM